MATGFNPLEYASHAFRIGAATEASRWGLDENTVRRIGRWESNRFRGWVFFLLLYYCFVLSFLVPFGVHCDFLFFSGVPWCLVWILRHSFVFWVARRAEVKHNGRLGQVRATS